MKMTNRKTTKRAIIASVMAMILCFAMFVGTTYAWFTDSVTSTGNKVVAGTLKIDLELKDAETNTYSSIKDTQAPIFNYDNWEPGYTDVKILKIENEGSLALKWYAKFVSEYELSALADVIQVYVNPQPADFAYPTDRATVESWTHVGTVRDFVNTIETTTYGTLAPSVASMTDPAVYAGLQSYQYLGIGLVMDVGAGNEYQGMSLCGNFDIVILATQETAEIDSIDDQYDVDAPRATQAQINAVAAKLANANDGDTIELESLHYGNLTLGSGAYAYDYPANLTIVGKEDTYFTGISISDEVISGWTFKNITFIGETTNNPGSADGLAFTTKSTVTDLTLDGCNFIHGAHLSMIKTTTGTNKNVTIKDCKFDMVANGRPAILVQAGENVTVEGCTFTNAGYNAMQLTKTVGTIDIVGNNINKTTDRAIRISNNGADVNVTNNVIVSDGDVEGQLMKSSGTNGTVTLSGNTWNGLTDSEVVIDDTADYIVSKA